jgi:tetratricopeptide (TPR) repeat protein
MDDPAVFVHVQQVLRQIEGNPKILTRCLEALNNSQRGQEKLSAGDLKGALPLLLAAHDLYEKIPAARYLLGISKTDLAAAYGNLGEIRKSARYAEAALKIVAGKETFAFTEAMAEMTLGNCLYQLGDPGGGAAHHDQARAILRRLPDTDRYLKAIEHNQEVFRR